MHPMKFNTPREINMLINIGGNPKTPHAKGIHWHIGTDVSYIATDKKRLDIPYIVVHGKDGKVTEYMDTEEPLTKDQIDKSAKRHMDCTDCHNRPTHIYRSPGVEMDENFISGHIDPALPYIKKISVEMLTRPVQVGGRGQGNHCPRNPGLLCEKLPEGSQG